MLTVQNLLQLDLDQYLITVKCQIVIIREISITMTSTCCLSVIATELPITSHRHNNSNISIYVESGFCPPDEYHFSFTSGLGPHQPLRETCGSLANECSPATCYLSAFWGPTGVQQDLLEFLKTAGFCIWRLLKIHKTEPFILLFSQTFVPVVSTCDKLKSQHHHLIHVQHCVHVCSKVRESYQLYAGDRYRGYNP